jgi:hypothetical protein
VKTVAHAEVLRSLKERLEALRSDSRRRWGTLTPHEMLCHLGDATDMVNGIRPRKHPVPHRTRRLLKLIVLWSPMRWPHGRPTNPMHDPRAEGTRPSVFDRDMARLLAGLEKLATASEGSLEPAHGLLGTMTTRDWQRWAYKHTDHHLRQFGL